MAAATTRDERVAVKPSAVQVLMRLIVAIPGSYGVGWAYTSFASILLLRAGLVRSDAVAWATLSAFVVMLGLALTAFSVRRLLILAASMAAAGGVVMLGAHLMGPA